MASCFLALNLLDDDGRKSGGFALFLALLGFSHNYNPA
jgi:hypothetical protein